MKPSPIFSVVSSVGAINIWRCFIGYLFSIVANRFYLQVLVSSLLSLLNDVFVDIVDDEGFIFRYILKLNAQAVYIYITLIIDT